MAKSHGAPLRLAGASLGMANLPHADLRGADLTGADLRGAMLWGALLDGARLDGADLTCANLTWASLRGCSTRETILIEADLDEATIEGFGGAVTAGADLCTAMFTLDELPRAAGAPAALRDAHREQDEAVILERHRRSAAPSLRARGAAGFANKTRELERAKARVLSDEDIHIAKTNPRPVCLFQSSARS